jgi:1,4-dihydroxy-6-naphthoate synthase
MSSNAALTLAYSPCPNDTYIFAALANGLLDDAPSVKVRLDDVETLNRAALAGTFALTKVSYGAIPELMGKYRILRSGGALGYHCGPLLVARREDQRPLEAFRDATIAIPGTRTTAFLLLRLALGQAARTVEMRFDRIVDAVSAGEVDAGLIIHETRFTYQDAGLVQIGDLGEWWERETGLPIPLGAILARNDLSPQQVRCAEKGIRASLQFARAHDAQVFEYVRQAATEMSDDVMRQHIALYVNDLSEDLGEQGQAAVRELFTRGRSAGYIEAAEPRFA